MTKQSLSGQKGKRSKKIKMDKQQIKKKNKTNANRQPNETIAAIATPIGMGGVAVVRISGKKAFDVATKLLRETNGKPLEKSLQKDRVMRLTDLYAEGVRDKALCVFFYAPNSYTGEDVAEIQTHGNIEIAEAVVRGAVKCGARVAEAGEFTRRAFLNGKMDLTAAEGIIDLIEAQGTAQLNAAYEQSEGKLYRELDAIFTRLIALAAKTEAAIDYPEEDIEVITAETVKQELTEIAQTLKMQTEGYAGAAMLREGVRTVLAGEANVGKSKLMNALLGRERAIVTAVAGTTRDTIEETFLYGGIKFTLYDTAGIRDTLDEVEKLGVARSKQALEAADLVLAVCERSKPFTIPLPKNKAVIFVENKADLLANKKGGDDEDNKCNTQRVRVSALTQENLDTLKDKMLASVKGKIAGGGARLNNERQYQSALKAMQIVARALSAVNNLSLDCVASDVTAAAAEIGKITGKTASEEVVAQIFARFCVGK